METTNRIVKAVGKPQVTVYIVDPSDYANSYFASTLEVAPQEYLCLGWCDFMRELTQRVIEEHRVAIVRTCNELAQEDGIETEGVAGLCHRLTQLGLIGLGKLRATWMLEDTSYSPYQQGSPLRLFSSLILGVRSVESSMAWEARFREDGLVEFVWGGLSRSCHGLLWRGYS